jgi:hypothetical protein
MIGYLLIGAALSGVLPIFSGALHSPPLASNMSTRSTRGAMSQSLNGIASGNAKRNQLY